MEPAGVASKRVFRRFLPRTRESRGAVRRWQRVRRRRWRPQLEVGTNVEHRQSNILNVAGVAGEGRAALVAKEKDPAAATS